MVSEYVGALVFIFNFTFTFTLILILNLDLACIYTFETNQVLIPTTASSSNNNMVNDSPTALLHSGQTVKKKRGRPRKQAPLSAVASSSSMPASAESSGNKRVRGRPPGTGKWQQIASVGGYVAETAGGSFKPHVMTVNTGEDAVRKLLTYFKRGTQSVGILSATGAASKVVISKRGGSSNDSARYEGLFEILSLSGSYLYNLRGGGVRRRKNIMLSVSFVDADGTVFGGAPLDSLIAARPIQLLVATFKQDTGAEIMSRKSAGSSSAAAPNKSSDSRLIEGEKSHPSPTSGPIPTTNELPENTTAVTTTSASNVIHPNFTMHSFLS